MSKSKKKTIHIENPIWKKLDILKRRFPELETFNDVIEFLLEKSGIKIISLDEIEEKK